MKGTKGTIIGVIKRVTRSLDYSSPGELSTSLPVLGLGFRVHKWLQGIPSLG